MLDALFNEVISVRRLTGARDGHGKPTYAEVSDGTAPYFIDCYIERRRRTARDVRGTVRDVDATLIYNVSTAPFELHDDDLLVTLGGEAFKAVLTESLTAALSGETYGRFGLEKTRFPVEPDSNPPHEV
jgi:hypothetical protein